MSVFKKRKGVKIEDNQVTELRCTSCGKREWRYTKDLTSKNPFLIKHAICTTCGSEDLRIDRHALLKKNKE